MASRVCRLFEESEVEAQDGSLGKQPSLRLAVTVYHVIFYDVETAC